MSILKLLTYDIKEHNRSLIKHVESGWPTFWRSLGRRYHRALRWNNIMALWHYFWHPFYKEVEPLKPILFVTISNNNDRALSPMWDRLNRESYSIIDQRNHNREIPVALILFYSLLFIWPLLKCYLGANKYEKSIIAEWFDDFFDTIGFLLVIKRLLRHSDVRLLVMANDHTSFNRAFERVANELGIKTMYTQHCSVTEDFPPLEFSYSFLDGEESLIKYIAHDKPKGVVYLAGNTRFDIIKQYRTLIEMRGRIGVASNALDKEDKVRELCSQLQANGYTNITIRPHPGLPFDPQWYLEHGIEYSDSNNENPFEFLSRMKYVISGECGIHLDAALMDVFAIYYNMTDNPTQDVYSFIKNGITLPADSFEQLLGFLKNDVVLRIKDVSAKMRWYNAAYGMPVEGHAGEMMADFIRYEQEGDVDGFDMKYGFVDKEINGVICKVYK